MTMFTIRSGATSHPESSVLQFFTDLVKESGVVSLSADHLKVVEIGEAGLSVNILQGRGWVKKDNTNAYPVRSTATENVEISSNASGNPRKDAVVIYADLSETPSTDADNVIKTVSVNGTPAASPQAPSDADISTAIGSGNPFIRVANVTLASGAGEITDANIEDTRQHVKLTDSVLPDGVVTEETAQTLANKRINKRVTSITSSSTPTPNADTDDVFLVTAQAAAATFAAPTGTAINEQGLIIRIKDNGTARALSWNAIYRAIGLSLPTTTVANKTMYLGLVYNSQDTKWDVVALSRES